MANNYGTNLNSFSEGLMTGYNFVDAIFDRRQQAKDRQRALELENERIGMARESHKTSMEGIARDRKFEDQDRERDAGDRVGKEANDAAAYYGSVDKVPPELRLQTYRKLKPDATQEEADAQFGSLAMRGGDFIEGAALKERDRQAMEDSAAGVLSTGAPKGEQAPQPAAGPVSRPLAAGGTRGGRGRTGGKSFSMLQFNEQEDSHLRAIANGDANKELFLRIAPTIENRGSRDNMYSGDVSSAGAAGPYQFMAGTAQAVGLDPAQRNDFFASATGAGKLYDDLNQRYGGNMRAMLADYNGGPAAGKAVMEGRLPPAQETRDYLAMADDLLSKGTASISGGPIADNTRRVATPDPVAPEPDLRAQQKAKVAADNAPIAAPPPKQPIKRTPEQLWGGVADLRQQSGMERQIRENPALYTHQWLAERGQVSDPQTRYSVDVTVRNGLQDEVKLRRDQFNNATDPKTKQQAATLLKMREGQLAEVSKLAANSAIDARMPRSMKPGATPAAAMAVAVQDQQGMPKQSSPDEMRLLGTQMDRMAAGKQERYSPQNVKRVARAVSLGVITMEQGKNLLETGTMDKREKTQYVNVGEGYVIADNGETREIIDLSAHVAARKAEGKEGSLESGQRSLRHRANVEYADKQLTAMQEDGEFDFHWLGGGAKPHAVVGGFFESVSKAAPQLKSKYNIDVIDPDTGTMTLGHLSEGEIQSLIGWYSKQRSQNQDAWLFPEQKDLSQYGPQVSAPSDGGYKITPVQ